MTTTEDRLRQAVQLLQANRAAEAENLLADLLRQSPDNADALALLGLAYAQRDDNARAAEFIGRALAINPNLFAAQVNLAKVLAKLERWPEVVVAATNVLAKRPDHAEGRRLRGHALAELKRDAEALSDLDSIVTDNVGTLLIRAKLRHGGGRAADAVADYDRIVALMPAHWEAWNNRGIALEALSRHDEALANYERALALNPSNTSVQHNRAAVLIVLKREEEALPLFEQLIVAEPDNVDNWNGHGAALAGLLQLDRATASFDKAQALDPNSVRALVCRGTVLAALERTPEALTDYRRAITLDAGNATAHANLAFALLADGNLPEGFAEYEWRRKDGPIQRTERRFASPEWQGEDIAGKTLLLHPEQGLGDIIQFSRFVPQLSAGGARVLLEVPAALETLVHSLGGNPSIVRTGTPLPPHDLHAPLMSLGHKLALTLETIPAPVPYLAAPPDRHSRWQERLAPLAHPRVGLCWSGNPAHNNDRARSIPLAAFSQVTNVPGISFVSLQHDLRTADADAYNALRNVANFMPAVDDLADTAALIAQLDLVICVDTSVAHLAGALGKPVWILLATSADWRWLKRREDSPWYPTARLFRQTSHGVWQDVMERVRAELAHRYTRS